MVKKKGIFISIFIVIVVILLVAGATYAYLLAMTNEGDVSANTGKVDVNYSAPKPLTGNLSPSSDRSGGLSTFATASLNSGSVETMFNMYIKPTTLTNLNIAALKWEVEAIRDDAVVEECSGNGDFSDAIVNTKIDLVSGCKLSDTTTTFNIYIWLDQSLIETEISDAGFNATISADSVPITGSY